MQNHLVRARAHEVVFTGRNRVPRQPATVETKRSVDALANHEIVTLAVALCGGQLHPVDTEDVAVKAHEVAPGRFAWRKYPKQISLDAVRKRLWDAQSTEKGYGYVAGSERTGWTLTPAGQKFCTEHLESTQLSGKKRQRLSVDEKRWVTRERSRLLQSIAYQKFLDGSAAEITRREAELVFRVDDYVTGEARQRKIDRLVNLLGDDETLGPLIQELSKQLNLHSQT